MSSPSALPILPDYRSAADIEAAMATIRKGRVVTASTATAATKAKGTALYQSALASVTPPAKMTAKPAPATIGNGIFKPTVSPTMTRAEWQTLSAHDKSRFFTEGGKLVDPPEAAKPHRVNGQLTRAGFDAMSPAAKSAHCKSGAGIIA